MGLHQLLRGGSGATPSFLTSSAGRPGTQDRDLCTVALRWSLFKDQLQIIRTLSHVPSGYHWPSAKCQADWVFSLGFSLWKKIAECFSQGGNKDTKIPSPIQCHGLGNRAKTMYVPFRKSLCVSRTWLMSCTQACWISGLAACKMTLSDVSRLIRANLQGSLSTFSSMIR